MSYEDFYSRVTAAGLQPHECCCTHWKIIGARTVDFWPTPKGGTKARVQGATGKGEFCPLDRAIKWAGKQPEEVVSFDGDYSEICTSFVADLAVAAKQVIATEPRGFADMPIAQAEAYIALIKALKVAGYPVVASL